MAKFLLCSLALAGFALTVPGQPAPTNNTIIRPNPTPVVKQAGTNLVFDATTKEFNAKPGELTAEFDFSVTNTGPAEITVNSVRASCGCTTPKLPALPWKLEPNASGSFHVTIDLRGKFGSFQKSVFMDTTEGPKMVFVKVNLPINPNGMAGIPGIDARTRNMQIAQADPQAIFRNDCATCHSKPAIGKKGEQLFTTACAICHESDQRAVLVPDLHALKQTPTAAYWDAWIRNGKVGTMMPAFSENRAGPLTDEQVQSLVEYLVTEFPKREPHGHSVVTASAAAAPQPQIELPGNLPLLAPRVPRVEITPPVPSPVAEPNAKN